jgi:hypothetical protein
MITEFDVVEDNLKLKTNEGPPEMKELILSPEEKNLSFLTAVYKKSVKLYEQLSSKLEAEGSFEHKKANHEFRKTLKSYAVIPEIEICDDDSYQENLLQPITEEDNNNNLLS